MSAKPTFFEALLPPRFGVPSSRWSALAAPPSGGKHGPIRPVRTRVMLDGRSWRCRDFMALLQPAAQTCRPARVQANPAMAPTAPLPLCSRAFQQAIALSAGISTGASLYDFGANPASETEMMVENPNESRQSGDDGSRRHHPPSNIPRRKCFNRYGIRADIPRLISLNSVSDQSTDSATAMSPLPRALRTNKRMLSRRSAGVDHRALTRQEGTGFSDRASWPGGSGA